MIGVPLDAVNLGSAGSVRCSFVWTPPRDHANRPDSVRCPFCFYTAPAGGADGAW